MNRNHTPVDVSHIASFDADGALQEAAERVNHSNRRSFLRGAGVLAGGVTVFGALPGLARAQGSLPKGDVDILNYALTLEYLEAAFYREGQQKADLGGELARFAKTAGEHEDAHVKALKETLGDKAIKKPSFSFGDATGSSASFQATAMVLEDTGVRAYQGQAGNIKTKAVLKAAISIHPVEARHAAWVRSIAGDGSGQPSPAPDAFNPAADMATILAEVKGTGFLGAMASAGSASPVSGQPAVGG